MIFIITINLFSISSNQGDYDPTKTKVVHFSMNPAEIAQSRRAEEVRRLQAENARLSERVRLLETRPGELEDLTLQVEQRLQEPGTSKEVEGQGSAIIHYLFFFTFFFFFVKKTKEITYF